MAKTGPLEFIQQVRQEMAKVTWTTRNEAVVTTVMVLIMVALAATFFFVVDQLLSLAVKTFLGVG